MEMEVLTQKDAAQDPPEGLLAPPLDHSDIQNLFEESSFCFPNSSSDPQWMESLLDGFDFDGDFSFEFDDIPAKSDTNPNAEQVKEVSPPHPSSQTSSPSRSSDHSAVVDPRASGKRQRDDAEEEKRKARLIRNRESAQLSRQRKKNYIEELEEKVKTLNTTISELTNTVAIINAENMQLRQQLAAVSKNPKVGNNLPLAPMPYAWPGYFPSPVVPAMRVYPHGSQVPLVPIPRLKTASQTSASSAKGRKAANSSEQKSAKKIKKVSSVFFLGLFLFLCYFSGGIVPGTEVGISRSTKSLTNVTDVARDNLFIRSGGRVLSSLKEEYSVIGDSPGASHHFDKPSAALNGFGEDHKGPTYVSEGNMSEPLLASLYVPRNDKLVKIDGNLIIHAVLASEKASELSSLEAVGKKHSKGGLSVLKKEFEKNSLAIVTQNQREVASDASAVRKDKNGALAPNSPPAYGEDVQMTAADKSLQQWFREGHAGPVLSSGMCTEIFQFDASPNVPSAMNSKAVSPNQARNYTSKPQLNATFTSDKVNPQKKGRFSFAVPLPPAREPLRESIEKNITNEFERSRYHNLHHSSHSERIEHERGYKDTNKSSSMVVSILVDPREVDDDGVRSPGRLSRIFVVVLIDSVKYVTYSCMLPSKGPIPHVVTR